MHDAMFACVDKHTPENDANLSLLHVATTLPHSQTYHFTATPQQLLDAPLPDAWFL
jgi:hypothetical protein